MSVDVFRALRDLEHGHWPTAEQVAVHYDIPLTPLLRVQLEELRDATEALVLAMDGRKSQLTVASGVDDPFVCDLCGQLLPEGGRCNSGIHEGPDIPSNLFRGFAVRLSRSRFERVTPTPGPPTESPSWEPEFEPAIGPDGTRGVARSERRL